MSFHLKRQRPGTPSSMASASRVVLGSSGGSTEWIPAPLPDGVILASDTSAATWIEDSARQFRRALGALMPAGFEAYARVLHPAFDADHDPVRWSTVATWTGRTAHRLMQFERIAAIPDDPNARPAWGERPRAGEGPLLKLSEVLRPFTTRPNDCWIALWDGFGGLDMIEELESAPRVRIPHRDYLLFRGPIQSVSQFRRSSSPWAPPNIWWPDDRAWCVATDIDLDSTYVGGTKECINALLTDTRLEAYPAQIDDRIDVGSDEINPETPGGRRRTRG